MAHMRLTTLAMAVLVCELFEGQMLCGPVCRRSKIAALEYVSQSLELLAVVLSLHLEFIAHCCCA